MKKYPNGQEVSQSLLVNMPAVTENHRDCDLTIEIAIIKALYYVQYTTFVWVEKLSIH